MIVGSGSGCGWARSRLAFQGCDVRTRRSRRPTPEKRKRIDSMARTQTSDAVAGSTHRSPGRPTSLSSSSGATRSRRRYAFGGDSIFVDVGCYLGCSLCSLAELVCQAGNGITLIGVDTCRGSGPEGQRDTDRAQGRSAAWRRNHGGAVASQRDCVRLHRHGALLINSSVAASVLFQDDSLTMGPHRCAPRLRQCLVGHRGVGSVSRQRRLAVRRRLRRPPMAGRRLGGG